VTTGSKELPRSTPDIVYDKSATPPPMPPVKTVPEGSVPKDAETGQDVGIHNQDDYKPGAGPGYGQGQHRTVSRRLATERLSVLEADSSKN